MKLLRWLRNLLGSEELGSGEMEAAQQSARELPKGRGGASAPRRVTVGIDFGTSSTKVVFRDWNSKERLPYAVDFGVDLPGYTRFSRPSLIALDEDRLLFGEQVARLQDQDEGASVLQSAKVQLLDRKVEAPSLEIPWELPSDLARRGISVLEGLVTLFLADTIRQVLWVAARVYPSLPLTRMAFNLDVPVGGLDDEPVGVRFQRMLDVAIQLFRELDEGMTTSEALELWADTLLRVQENPPAEGERPGELVPEAEAIIQGVGSALGSRSSDLYHAIVDIGAGTTDVGWFKLVVSRAEDRLPFFAAHTRRVGCNDIDHHLAERVRDETGAARRAIQPHLVQMKPDLISGEECTIQVDGHPVTVAPKHLEEAAEQVAPKVYDHYSKMFKPAYKKEKNTDRWERIRTVVVGGGSLILTLRRCFEKHPRSFGKSVELVDISREMELHAAGASDRPPTREETPFLTAALGLSHPRAVMPEPIMPSDIDDDDSGSSGPTGLYDYKVDY